MEKALPVMDYVAFDSSVEATGDISNMTAEQYLSWVRYQANELPDVFTAEVDSSLYTGRQTKYMPEIEEVLPCPEHLLPSVEWERDVISAFSELRALLARLSLTTASRERKLVVPQLKDEQAWLRFCLGSEYPTEEIQRFIEPPKLSSPRSSMDVIEPNVDFLQRKLELSRSLEKVLRTGGSMITSTTYGSYEPHDDQTESDEEGITYEVPSEPTPIEPVSNYVVWTGVEDSLPTTSLLLQFDQVMTQRLLSYQVSWLEDRDAMSSPRGQWLYGLLARLEKPLDRTMASLLRELYRRCCLLRAALVEDDHTFDVQIASLNVLIVITGSYFGQGEEYSTLARGYDDDCDEEEEEEEGDEDEDEDEDEEDFDDDDDDDDGQYYFDSTVVNRVEEPLPGGYSIGDDIWSDPSAMAIEDDHMHLSPNSDHSYPSSYLKKRTAEGSAEEGEELEDEYEDGEEEP